MAQEWPWDDVFVGPILDVGPGDDPLVWQDQYIVPFDKPQGDANIVDRYYPPEHFGCIHGSQVMEHLLNPADFITRCLTILKPGGWIVMTVPDLDLYEKLHWPSVFNPDHKTTWSLWRKHWAPIPQRAVKHQHIFVPHWIQQFNVAVRTATLIDTNYDYLADDAKDQTWLRGDGVECFIEILLQKHP